MAPRKRTQKQLQLCLTLFARHLVMKLQLGAYVVICTLLFAHVLRETLPEKTAQVIFWMLILHGFSSGQSMDWAAALTRGILRALLDQLSH